MKGQSLCGLSPPQRAAARRFSALSHDPLGANNVTMSRTQWAIIVVAAAIILAMWLFPPWKTDLHVFFGAGPEWWWERGEQPCFLEYHWVGGPFEEHQGVEIYWELLVVQTVPVLLIVGGLLVLTTVRPVRRATVVIGVGLVYTTVLLATAQGTWPWGKESFVLSLFTGIAGVGLLLARLVAWGFRRDQNTAAW